MTFARDWSNIESIKSQSETTIRDETSLRISQMGYSNEEHKSTKKRIEIVQNCLLWASDTISNPSLIGGNSNRR